MVACWRINTDIGKVEIECDENSFLILSRTEHSRIGVTAQLLGEYGMDVVTGLLKQTVVSRGRFSSSLNRVGILHA